jgi:cobalamin biosynthesis protein CobD/CbiB
MRLSEDTNKEYKWSFLCLLGLHTRPIIIRAIAPVIFCTKCHKMLEPPIRTDLKFKINGIFAAILFILILLAAMFLTILGILHL